MKEEKKILKNPTRFITKLFILVWIVLILHISLKLTFNYWQPYIIPTPQLEELGNFIDNNRWIQIICNGIFYLINSIFAILCGLQKWWFSSKRESTIVICLILICFTFVAFGFTTIPTLFISLALPLLLNYKKWFWILSTFILSNLFLMLSLWLEGFTSANNMNYIVRMLLQGDYYIMLALNYILFNIIKKEKK